MLRDVRGLRIWGSGLTTDSLSGAASAVACHEKTSGTMITARVRNGNENTGHDAVPSRPGFHAVV